MTAAPDNPADASQATTPGEHGDRPWGLWTVAALAALLVFRLIALKLNATNLFFDEAQYWSWSREPALGYYSKPPLIAMLIKAATGLCGTSEFCVRLPSPLIHTATAAVVYGLGAMLYDRRTGFWSALTFATLPGISLSSSLISTDVPLLFFWALALLTFARLTETTAWWPALALGLALGFGLNAKYAMAYFIVGVLVYVFIETSQRKRLRDARLYVALAIAVAFIIPNLWWNASNQFATFAHTADNAKWGGPLFHPHKAGEFFASQFGVFGPILFASLLIVLVQAWRGRVHAQDRYLLAFAIPVIAIVTTQAFLSRAHANWAAVAYVSATVVVVALLVRNADWAWLRGSLIIHLVVVALLAVTLGLADRLTVPGLGNPFARLLGWNAVANETRQVLAAQKQLGQPIGAILTDDRLLTAELLYYLRGEATPIYAWQSGPRPRDHYQLTRPYRSGAPSPVLLVTLERDVRRVTNRFGSYRQVAIRFVPAGATQKRRVAFYLLAGFRP